MTIRIFHTIEDPFLQDEWERLHRNGDIFPQSSYHWCATWWKHLGVRYSLHIVMALDDRGWAVAIAPLCIERHFGVKVLRSFPIHFGDYYTFITAKDENSDNGVAAILQYLSDSNLWAWVRLEQIVETDVLAQLLSEGGYLKKRLTGSIIASIQGLSWEDYLVRLNRKFRQNIKRRQRKIENNFKVSLETITSWDGYACEYSIMREIHEQRWRDDNAPHKSAIENACWREAIKGQFNSQKMVYYKLLFNNNQVAAYRLGFIHQGTYYAWHTGFNPNYRDYYPGIMIMLYMIQELIEEDIACINFMAGEYDWKLDWSPDRTVVSHYMFSSPSANYCAAFLNFYHHRFRDYLKDWYHTMMKKRLFRALSRKLIAFQQRIAGQR